VPARLDVYPRDLASVEHVGASVTIHSADRPGAVWTWCRGVGRPVHELSNMAAAISANNNLLVYGDFSQYVITQRVGSSWELIPHLFGANRRPTGQRGA
jgi:hypothetical protein